jgi:fatty acid desaturase
MNGSNLASLSARNATLSSDPPIPPQVSAAGIQLEESLYRRFHQLSHRSLVRGMIFVGTYLLSGFLILRFHIQPTPVWPWIASLPFYLIAAASLHGISLLTHEAVHGVLARSPLRNRLFGVLCALPVLQNFSAYRVLHLRHHKHVGQAGDPDHYDNYSRWTWLVFTMHWVRLLIGYPIYLVMIPILGYRQGKRSDRRWIISECLLLLAVILAIAASPVPGEVVLHSWLIPMLLINTMVNIRGMSQHTFLEDPDDPVRGTRSILTNRVTAFFMCNENYHLEHHLFPRVPWYHLRALHETLAPQLIAREAPFVPSYFAFVREFVRKSWARSPWGNDVPER